MNRYNFVFRDISVCRTDAFSEARTDELKLLIALRELDGIATDEELSELAGISKTRCVSAVAFWQEAGVIAPAERSEYGSRVSEEFEENEDDALCEQTSVEVASEIRNKKLAGLIAELAKMTDKAMLSPAEVKKIALLTSTYGLSEDYIAALAAHLYDKGTLTVFKLFNRAAKLSEEGVDTAEELEIYINDKERERAEFAELRRALGINHKLSKSEKDYFSKWTESLSYSVEIIGEAYDIAVLNTGKLSFPYIDGILCAWHEAGCKTVAQCRESGERFRAQSDAQKAEKPVTYTAKVKKKETPRYGDFDPEEALKKALARSFPSDNEQ